MTDRGRSAHGRRAYERQRADRRAEDRWHARMARRATARETIAHGRRYVGAHRRGAQLGEALRRRGGARPLRFAHRARRDLRAFGPERFGQDDGHQLHIAAAHLRQGRHLPVRRAHDAHALRPEAQDRRGAAERGAVRGAHRAGEHRLLLCPVRGRSARAGAARGRGHRVRGPRGLREVPPAQALRAAFCGGSTSPAASPTGPGSPSSTSRRWRWIRRAATPFWRASAA